MCIRDRLGAIPGFAVGYVMLTRQWVDCEGGDLLSRNFGYKPELTEAKKKQLHAEKEQRRQSRRQEIAEIRTQIAEHISQGRFSLAAHRLETLRRKHHGKANFTPGQLVKVIRAFDADPDRQQESVFLLNRFLKENSDVPPILLLAKARHLLLFDGRPRKALKLLKNLQPSDPQQQQLRTKLVRFARQQMAKGNLELAEA